MARLLCTIGFTGKTAEEFFSLLQDAGVEQVIDIRQNRSGQLSGFSKDPDLSFFLKKIAGISYRHEPDLAPPPELLKNYRRNKDWPVYEDAFLGVMKERGVPRKLDTSAWTEKIALLCSEPGPERCHRRLVADLLVTHWSNAGEAVELRHLVSAKAKSAKPRGKNASTMS